MFDYHCGLRLSPACRQVLTTLSRLRFSNAAATRSLSASCLLTVSQSLKKEKHQEKNRCREAISASTPPRTSRFCPDLDNFFAARATRLTCVFRLVSAWCHFHIDFKARRQRPQQLDCHTQSDQRSHAAVRNGRCKSHFHRAAVIIYLNQFCGRERKKGNRQGSASQEGATSKTDPTAIILLGHATGNEETVGQVST